MMKVDKIHQLAMSDNGFVFDPLTGYSYNVNETGRFILKCMNEGKNKDEIIHCLLEEFEVELDLAENDMNYFISQLSVYQLI